MRRTLRIGDILAISIAYIAVFGVHEVVHHDSWSSSLVVCSAMVAIGLWAVRSQSLWVERIIAVRSIELARITRAVGIMLIGLLVADGVVVDHVHTEGVLLSCGVVWMLLVVWRSIYRAWLVAARRNGRYTRRVVIVGTDRRAVELVNVFGTHPEAGMQVEGMIGSYRETVLAGLGHLWMGYYDQAPHALASVSADVVVLSPADLSPTLLNQLIHDERSRQRDLYIDPGVSRVDSRRLQPLAISYEPLLHVNAPALATLQEMLKRASDLVVASLLLVLASPVMAALALAIWLEDRGPVFFRQTRVGRENVDFQMIKFRSMAVDAEARLAELMEGNERTGPLFKLGVDPRVTRIGRFIRATSLDELPQLFNVLRGEMSLVGPRPALPSEVIDFPDDLHARHTVRPGITGLWQVEARDNPAFEAYRRLDLFYVENWSLALDFVILLGTVEQVILRGWLQRVGEGDDPGSNVDVVQAYDQMVMDPELEPRHAMVLGDGELPSDLDVAPGTAPRRSAIDTDMSSAGAWTNG